MATTKRVSIALLAPGFALAFLLPVLGVIAMFAGGILLAIALENDLDNLVAAEPLSPTTLRQGTLL